MEQSIQNIWSPLKFLDPYDREDGDQFFGRALEVDRLYESVNKNRLVLIYGYSGTGKTSLVQCGLANRFEVTDWLPFFIRRGQDINTSLFTALTDSRAMGGHYVNEENILSTLERISTRCLRPVYLIFDQFEELLVLGDEKYSKEKDQEVERFIQLIQKIVESKKTRSIHLIFIIREEYFAALDRFDQAIPLFTHRRLRVEPMRQQQLEAVIQGTCDFFNITIEKGIINIRKILNSLKVKGRIPLPYLQVYLDMLWREDFKRTYPAGWNKKGYPEIEFTTAEINSFGSIHDVLDRFLTAQLEVIQMELKRSHPSVKSDFARKVLNEFATEEGTKRPIRYYKQEDQIILIDPPPFIKEQAPGLISDCLVAFQQKRLLRYDDTSYELAHDSLAMLLDLRRTDEERQLNEIRKQIVHSYHIFQNTNEYLTQRQLSIYNIFLPEIILEAPVAQFVRESQYHRRTEQQQQFEEIVRKRKTTATVAAFLFLLSVVSVAMFIKAERETQEKVQALSALTTEKDKVDQLLEQVKEEQEIASVRLDSFLAEEATRVSLLVDDLVLRAEKLEKDYPTIYQQLIEVAYKELKAYPDNPILVERIAEIQALRVSNLEQ